MINNNYFPYKKVNLLTNAEMQLYNFMYNNLCQVDKLLIFTKVRLADIINVKDDVTDDNLLWKITNKHVDFLICKKETFDIICVVELDDYTHDSIEAKERDMFIMQALNSAGINVCRIKTKIRDISKKDLKLVDEYINIALAPRCSKCGKNMLPKEASDGHRFYACTDFIGCRHTLNIDQTGERLP